MTLEWEGLVVNPGLEGEEFERVGGELQRERGVECQVEPLLNEFPQELRFGDARWRSRSAASTAAIATLEGRERMISLTSGCGRQLPPA